MSNDSISIFAEAYARQMKARTSVLAQIEAFEPYWQTGWMHKDVCAHLDGVVTLVEQGRGQGGAGGPRLCVELPPGVGKTLMAGVHLMANTLGRHPDWHIIYGTFNADKACEVGRDTRARILDPRFAEIHPKCVLDKSAQSMDYLLTDQGGKVSFVGVEGGGMGKRAHLFVVDDPFKNAEEGRSTKHQEDVLRWLIATARTRLHPEGAIIVMHQRWHVEDLIGRLIMASKRSAEGDKWYDYKYPMVATTDETYRKKGEPLHAERFSKAWCDRTRASLIDAGQEWTWSAMYQQNPTLDTGMIFQRHWFKYFSQDKLPKNLRWFLTTDFATTAGRGDRYVCWPFAVDEQDNTYFLDPFYSQVDLSVGMQEVFKQYAAHQAEKVFVEKGVLWNASKYETRQLSMSRGVYPSWVEFTRTRKKADHAGALVGRMAQGKVWFLDSPFTHGTLVPQFLAFTGETGANEEDDLVDAAGLPFLSPRALRSAAPLIDLPVVQEVPALNQQIIEAFGDPDSDKKIKVAHAWCAGDL
jgi:hypothetical protein